MATGNVTQERLNQVFSYDKNTGVFIRILTIGSGRFKLGQIAGYTCKKTGYRHVGIDYRQYLEHRLAWLYVYGNWPINDIDHIDGDKLNNRLSNLRDVSVSVNIQNQRRPQSGNKSGYLGVHWDSRDKTWLSTIGLRGKKIRIGSFKTAEEASAAYITKKRELHLGSSL